MAQSVLQELQTVVCTRIGTVLEELQQVGSPCRIILGRRASYGMDPTVQQGKRVTMKDQ